MIMEISNVFFARDTARSQEESLTAPLSAIKPHEDLPSSPIHEIESDIMHRK